MKHTLPFVVLVSDGGEVVFKSLYLRELFSHTKGMAAVSPRRLELFLF